MSDNNRDTYGLSRRNYNSFSPLLNYNIYGYNCNNYGHIENCVEVISEKIKKRKPQQSWKEIRNKGNKTKKNPCSYKLHCVHKIIGIQWYIDSGCSSHMTKDRTKFITLKKNEDSVTFGDNDSSKIVGKCNLSLDNGRDKVEKVMCVEYLKHNILSVSQMCDQGSHSYF
jgi:hypothetical protein